MRNANKKCAVSAYCCEAEGRLWVRTTADYARGARKAWCEDTGYDWTAWRKLRPTLRVVKVEVRRAQP